MGVYTEMAQNYLRLDEKDVDKAIMEGDNLTYKSLKGKIDNYYEKICAIFNEINELLEEVQTKLIYDNYIADTIEEIKKRKAEFDNKYIEIKGNFDDKCNLLLSLYHGVGLSKKNLDKLIINFSKVIESKFPKNK